MKIRKRASLKAILIILFIIAFVVCGLSIKDLLAADSSSDQNPSDNDQAASARKHVQPIIPPPSVPIGPIMPTQPFINEKDLAMQVKNSSNPDRSHLIQGLFQHHPNAGPVVGSGASRTRLPQYSVEEEKK